MHTLLPSSFRLCLAILSVWAVAGMAHAQDDAVVIESGGMHTLRLDTPAVQIVAVHDAAALHAVADSGAAGAAEPGVDGGVSEAPDVPAPAQIRAVAKCGDGSLVYSRHGTLCAEHGGITRLYQ